MNGADLLIYTARQCIAASIIAMLDALMWGSIALDALPATIGDDDDA